MKLNTTCNSIDFDDFVLKHNLVHYTKTSMWAQNKNNEGTPVYLGFVDNNQLIGTALAFKRKWHNKTYFYIPWGPCLNTNNLEQFKEALQLCIQYARKENAFFLRTDFNIQRVSRDIDGNQIDGINNEHITELLKEIGFKHKGYGYAYNGSWVNRYTLIANLDKPLDEILKSYHKARQTAIKRHSIIGVTTHLATQSEISYLMEFEKELAEIQGFKPHTRTYFENIMDSFKDHARFYITEIDLKQMVAGLDEEIHSKKYAKDKEALASKEKEYNEAVSLHSKYGDNVVIAAGLFLYVGNTSYDLYTYNRKEFNFVKPVDNLHYFAMNDMKNLGVLKYDMCGFSGVTNSDDPYYGLYSYKKSFGSEFTEYIGEFDYILNVKNYTHFIKSIKLKGKIKRKLNSILYKKKNLK
ncbi:lipid II:glycine glycyltransferase FemX [Anaerorhabdus sp.]|uniref:lipid II:glycine glycyltransferase FemX n=1 Tax=Anaerorhabdus sp. TaxID=1872524 RepID=UPI002FCBFCA5